MDGLINSNNILHGPSRRPSVQGPRQSVQRMRAGEKLANASFLLRDKSSNTINDNRNQGGFSRCGRCKICQGSLCINASRFKSSVTQKHYQIDLDLSCRSKDVIYLKTCNSCGMQYVGKTIQEFKTRMGQHEKDNLTLNTHLARHCRKEGHEFTTIAIAKFLADENRPEFTIESFEVEWMKELRTIYPYGLNERVKGIGDISTTGLNVDSLGTSYKRNKRSHGHRSNRARHLSNWTLDSVMALYRDDDPLGLHNLRTTAYGLPNNKARQICNEALSLIYSSSKKYPKQILRVLYDLLSRKLLPPSKETADTKEAKLFMTLLFHNKGMDLINLPRILNNRTVMSKIPDYFEHTSPPSLCYKYTNTIASQIFNHKQMCTQFTQSDGPDSFMCECDANSKFVHPNIGHIVTGDLDIVQNLQLRKLLLKGPKFREQNHINWRLNRKLISDSLNTLIAKWSKLEDADIQCLKDYHNQVMNLVDNRIAKLKQTVKSHRPRFLDKPAICKELERLQHLYIMAPADKAANNVIFICKRWYMEQIVKELHLDNGNPETGAYKVVDNVTSDYIVTKQLELCSEVGLKANPRNKVQLPVFYGIPKMHKATPKLRYIAASCKSPLKPVDLIVTKCLSVIYKFMVSYCKGIYKHTGVNRMWIIDNSLQLKQKIAECNEHMKAVSLSTWDFSTLYTTIPHELLKNNICELIDFSFKTNKKPFIAANNFRAFWSNKPVKNYKCVTANELKEYIVYLIDNIYILFGDTLHQQVIGIPMGISCAPLLANLFLMTFEYSFMQNLTKKDIHKARNFNYVFRYIDDLICLNNEYFSSDITLIYPPELDVKKENHSPHEAAYLDLLIRVQDDTFQTSLYDKRDSFNFGIVNYPYVSSSNIPQNPAYGVYTSRLVSIARACDHYKDFEQRHNSLCTKLLQQGFKYEKLKKQLHKTLSRHRELFVKYDETIYVPLPITASDQRHVTLRVS